MRLLLYTPKCPTCGRPARGASDFIPGIALFNGDPSSGHEWITRFDTKE